jgi:DGQHR domain-containing protein
MEIPYIKIRQRSEVFYVTKFKAGFLLDHVNFHYREPYSEFDSQDIVLSNKHYIQAIRDKGISLSSNEEGIQRRLQITRINSIKKFIEEDSQNFLPNTVILSADISQLPELEERFVEYEEREAGVMEFPDNFLFSIIDGQHRLAGLSIVESQLVEEFEIPAVILFNVSLPVAAKLFADINGKQKAVNRSLIYDLYSEIDSDDFSEIRRFHVICENLYKSVSSPLYRQIKMLGIGSGAISQAFFIDYSRKAIRKTTLASADTQTLFTHLVLYFRAYQESFPEDWPVPLGFVSDGQLDQHARFVLKDRNSQLVKTNGFGAIMRAFPTIHALSKGDATKYKTFVEMQKGRISWIKPPGAGTGTGYQKSLLDQILLIYERQLHLFDTSHSE